MSGEKIIQHTFGKADALPENILKVERGTDTCYCAHGSILLDEHLRQVQCAKCGAVLDAFDFLRGNGTHIQRAWNNYRQAQGQVAALNESIAKLAREEKRLKALIRRLQDKSGAKLDVRGPH